MLMEIKVREYEQMMLGGYIKLVPGKLFNSIFLNLRFSFVLNFD